MVNNFCVFNRLVVVVYLMFAYHGFSMSYVKRAAQGLDNVVSSSIHRLAESKPTTLVCKFLIAVAKEVDSCESYKAYDWHDVAYTSYQVGKNPHYPLCMAFLAFSNLSIVHDREMNRLFICRPEKPNTAFEYPETQDILTQHRNVLYDFRNREILYSYTYQDSAFFKEQFLSLMGSYQKSAAVRQVINAFPHQDFQRLITNFVWYTEPQEDWAKFTLNNDLSDSYESDQMVYGSLLSATTQVVAELMREGANFEQIEAAAAFGRSLVNLHTDRYGEKREAEMYTSTTGPYRIMVDRFDDLASEWTSSGAHVVEFDNWSTYSQEHFEFNMLLLHIWDDDFEMPNYHLVSCKGNISGTLYPLSQFVLSDWVLSHILHTPMSVLKDTNYGVNLFSQLLHEAMLLKEEKAIIKKLGEFFWWYCKMKPLVNGDPSAAEIIIKAVLHAKALAIPGWKSGIKPWVEAELTCGAVEFGEKFHQFLEY